MLRYYLFEGMRYVWLVKKGTFCRVRYCLQGANLSFELTNVLFNNQY